MADPRSKSTKSPAFQFYPESWFSSSKVQRMSHTERGIYIDLLAYCWLENGLPVELSKLAAMVKIPTQRFTRMWNVGALHECFFERSGRLFNGRQERERKKQADHRKDKQKAAVASWESRRNADALQTEEIADASAMLSVSISSSLSDSVSKKNKNNSAESHDSSPAVMAFPVSGNPAIKTWPLTQSRIDGWTAAYPHLDVRGECRRALVWVEANGSKTAKGMPAFLVRWLNNAVNRGGARPLALAPTGTEGRGRTGAPPRGKYDGIEISDETEGR